MHFTIYISGILYACPGSMQPFLISREPVWWPWCHLAASQTRPYCASVKSHSPGRLVSRQWEAVDRACAPYYLRIYNDRASRSANLHQCFFLFYSPCAGFFWKKTSRHPGLSAPLQPRFGSLRLLAFPKVKIAVERGEICECDGHTVYKLNQRRLTAEWLALRQSDYSLMRSKVSFGWLPSYIKATLPVLEIFKMAAYFPDRPHIFCTNMCILNFKGWDLKPETEL